jgi:outer membrane lipoprotein-sorting protein
MHRRRFIMAAAAALSAPGLAWAQQYAAATLTREQRTLVDQATAYLEGLTTAKGRFVQSSSRGGSASGVLYLSRPGKARFEYDPPAQMLVVADGKNVSVHDRRLKTFNRYPQGSTPLAIFLAKRVRLDFLVMISRFTKTADGFTLTLRDSRGGTSGYLLLDFAQAPLALRGWTVVDGRKTETRVQLASLEPVGALDPGLFALRDPRVAS